MADRNAKKNLIWINFRTQASLRLLITIENSKIQNDEFKMTVKIMKARVKKTKRNADNVVHKHIRSNCYNTYNIVAALPSLESDI